MQDSQWIRDNTCGVRQQRLPHYWIIFWQDSAKTPPFTQFFGVDAKYAKHLRGFGEMCVVADTENKVRRTKIDPRGKVRFLLGAAPNVHEMSTVFQAFSRVSFVDV